MDQLQVIYLDNNATTPCDPQVLEKMLPFFNQLFANPANGYHRLGRLAAKAVENAREQVASLIGANPEEIFFTGGASESNNLAISGLARMAKKGERTRIVTSKIEHKAVLLPCEKLASEGFEVIFLPVDSKGRVSISEAKAAINDNTLMVSIQTANNELGVIQPISEIAELSHQYGAFFHTDAAQAVGKIPINLQDTDIDLLSISAHKLYGPKGVGAIFIRGGNRRIPIEPLILGGGQEKGVRSGTSNVPGIVGFGEACQIVERKMPEESKRIGELRDLFEQSLKNGIDGLEINGSNVSRLPNTSSLTFPNVEAETLLLNLPDVMLGTGSACHSGAIEPSHVLQAIGLSRQAAYSTIRASFGRFSTKEEVDLSCELIKEAWKDLTK